jgi:hypothetical protein
LEEKKENEEERAVDDGDIDEPEDDIDGPVGETGDMAVEPFGESIHPSGRGE